MADKLRYIRPYTVELTHSLRPWLLLAAVGSALCIYLDSPVDIQTAIQSQMVRSETSVSCIVHYITMNYCLGGVFCSHLMPAFAALPYAACYAMEEEGNFVIYKIARSGKRPYSAAKLLAATACGFLSQVLGILIFTLVLSAYVPLTTPQDILESQFYTFSSLMSKAGGVPFLAVIAYMAALSGALWAGAGLWVSAYLPNRYIALCAPILLKFLLSQAGKLLGLPFALRLDELLCLRGQIVSDNITLAVTTAAVLILILLMGWDFRRRIERRMDSAS